TSVGALNAGYIAAHAGEDTATLIDQGCEAWREIGYRDVLEPLLSLEELTTVVRLATSLAFRGIAPYTLLDPAPLAGTLRKLIDFKAIHRNINDPDVGLRVCSVIATAAHTNRSVVFHDGGPNPRDDERRGIDYVPTSVLEDHVLASAAIPVLFPVVRVEAPKNAEGWYFDGGTRLNTPIKPALQLGADRLIVIGLNSLGAAPKSRQRPDLFDGASQIIQGLLVDPVVNDVETLATMNRTLMHRGAAGSKDQRKVVPYIFVAPETPNAIGEIAGEIYDEFYAGVRGLWRSRDLALLGRLIGPTRSSTRGELFSYVFFAREFAARLIELGREDAARWIDQRHDDGPWQRGPLPRA
ncbi:MAG: patatin-like phospholipase family protein, partial [Solirubrobacterales bacterium]|nr:patatin-like phospholipase family protein [Solirubrobacterales bacterium]